MNFDSDREHIKKLIFNFLKDKNLQQMRTMIN